jgi:hypothetical protein
MGTKLNMIKFVEILRLNLGGRGKAIKWKQGMRR